MWELPNHAYGYQGRHFKGIFGPTWNNTPRRPTSTGSTLLCGSTTPSLRCNVFPREFGLIPDNLPAQPASPRLHMGPSRASKIKYHNHGWEYERSGASHCQSFSCYSSLQNTGIIYGYRRPLGRICPLSWPTQLLLLRAIPLQKFQERS